MKSIVKILPDADSASRFAAQIFLEHSAQASRAHRNFSVAFSGGSTPRVMLEYLAQPQIASEVNWNQVNIYQVDERYVPRNSIHSNARMLQEALLGRVNIPPANIHLFPVELPFEDSAEAYHNTLIQNLGNQPVLDLAYLGMGADGHTASLFPDSEALDVHQKYAATAIAEAEIPRRLTITRPTIKNAALVVFLITGASKAQVVAECLSDTPSRHPADTIAREAREVIWVLDTPAAAGLDTNAP